MSSAGAQICGGPRAKAVSFGRPEPQSCRSEAEDEEAGEGDFVMCRTLTESTKACDAADFDDDSCSEASSAESDGALLAAAADAVAAAENCGDGGCLAQALYWQTEALMQNGDYEEASEVASRALALFREVNSQHGEARVLLACAALSGIAGKPADALAQAGMALALARLCGDEDLESEARITHRGCLAASGH